MLEEEKPRARESMGQYPCGADGVENDWQPPFFDSIEQAAIGVCAVDAALLGFDHFRVRVC